MKIGDLVRLTWVIRGTSLPLWDSNNERICRITDDDVLIVLADQQLYFRISGISNFIIIATHTGKIGRIYTGHGTKFTILTK